MVSDEGHNYAREIVTGKDAAQSFSFLFYWSWHENGLVQTISLSWCPFVRFLQPRLLLDDFINCALFPWVLVINCDDKWKFFKINLFSQPCKVHSENPLQVQQCRKRWESKRLTSEQLSCGVH